MGKQGSTIISSASWLVGATCAGKKVAGEKEGRSMPDIRESTSPWLGKLVHVHVLSHVKIPVSSSHEMSTFEGMQEPFV